MEFEWDPTKDQGNQEKHGISFAEAATAFDDELQLTISDPDHSVGEHRYLTIAMTDRGRVIVVSHTENDDDHVRIISARSPTVTERRAYEEGE